MPCPLFQPTVPLGGFAPDAAPLGDLYGGECATALGTLIPLDTIRQYCNFGYARAVCVRAAGVEADAARFVIQSHSGETVRLSWATETNHHPLAVGAITLLTTSASQTSADQPLERQARAYVRSYLRRTGKS